MAWLAAGASILGGLISSSGSRSAGDAAGAGSLAAVDRQRRQFDIATGLARPSIEAGDTARDQLLRLLGLAPTQQVQGQTGGNFRDLVGRIPGGQRGRFPGGLGGFGQGFLGGNGGLQGQETSADPLDVIRNTPGFEFQLEQGRRALNTNRSAGGISGGELIKDFARFNQGVASNFYQDYANRLANLAGTGQTAATSAGTQGIISGRGIGNALQNAGLARASGIIGSSNAFGNVFNDLFQAFGSGAFGNLFGGAPGGGGGVGNIGTT